jgi:hypothetical protein
MLPGSASSANGLQLGPEAETSFFRRGRRLTTNAAPRGSGGLVPGQAAAKRAAEAGEGDVQPDSNGQLPPHCYLCKWDRASKADPNRRLNVGGKRYCRSDNSLLQRGQLADRERPSDCACDHCLWNLMMSRYAVRGSGRGAAPSGPDEGCMPQCSYVAFAAPTAAAVSHGPWPARTCRGGRFHCAHVGPVNKLRRGVGEEGLGVWRARSFVLCLCTFVMFYRCRAPGEAAT